ncbi:MAG TPA: orotidine-5'-phosphate decarboxylase [Chitinophagaceae bacterium]|nr:orotidine-5'-phosphate decarboxylase [Chitinophagaceae bacterium]
MTRQQLVETIFDRRSYLCVGLDTSPEQLPPHLSTADDPVLEFNRGIIDKTREYCVAYKINTAFYEARGAKGWEALERTVQYIPAGHLRIADAKRGDIGNSSAQYAKTFFETLGFDAVTVSPYMGEDSIRPFLEWEGKWTIVLGLTSNPGAADFELQTVNESREQLEKGVYVTQAHSPALYELVLRKVSSWGSPEQLMFVIGATRPEMLRRCRQIAPDHFFLVPGVGAQGGSLEEVSRQGWNRDCGLLVNVSRAIIHASAGKDFAEAAMRMAAKYREEMKGYFAL